MPTISLTDFLEVIRKSGQPKATCVRQIKYRDPYSPAFDLYKDLRDTIVELHKKKKPKTDLKNVLKKVEANKLKSTKYPDLVKGYVKWLGRKDTTWFTPQTTIFNASGTDISVNPELGLLVNGIKYVIKLYFKSDPLPKNQATIATGLMALAFNDEAPTYAVLDVKRSLLHSFNGNKQEIKALVAGEGAYITATWEQL